MHLGPSEILLAYPSPPLSSIPCYLLMLLTLHVLQPYPIQTYLLPKILALHIFLSLLQYFSHNAIQLMFYQRNISSIIHASALSAKQKYPLHNYEALIIRSSLR